MGEQNGRWGWMGVGSDSCSALHSVYFGRSGVHLSSTLLIYKMGLTILISSWASAENIWHINVLVNLPVPTIVLHWKMSLLQSFYSEVSDQYFLRCVFIMSILIKKKWGYGIKLLLRAVISVEELEWISPSWHLLVIVKVKFWDRMGTSV